MKNIKTLFALLLIGFLFTSCGSTREAAEGAGLGKASPRTLLKTHHKNAAQFKTLNAKLKGDFEDEHTKQSVNLSLRIKKNDTIWISAQKLGFTLAKLLVTKDGVQFYEKINGKYFNGDFSLLKEWLGMDLNFENFQNLLTGQILVDANFHSYVLQTDEHSYTLNTTQAGEFLQKILFDRKTLSLKEEQLKQPPIEDIVQIRYPSYFSGQHENFPDKIYITASKPHSKVHVQLRYRSLDLDTPTRFPFSIPKGYTEIKTKK